MQASWHHASQFRARPAQPAAEEPPNRGAGELVRHVMWPQSARTGLEGGAYLEDIGGSTALGGGGEGSSIAAAVGLCEAVGCQPVHGHQLWQVALPLRFRPVPAWDPRVTCDVSLHWSQPCLVCVAGHALNDEMRCQAVHCG